MRDCSAFNLTNMNSFTIPARDRAHAEEMLKKAVELLGLHIKHWQNDNSTCYGYRTETARAQKRESPHEDPKWELHVSSGWLSSSSMIIIKDKISEQS